MANGAQMKQAIEEATRKVAAHGYADDKVSTKDVLLAGLGYVAVTVEETVERRTTTIRLDGKRFFWVGTGLTLFNVIVGILFTLMLVV